MITCVRKWAIWRPYINGIGVATICMRVRARVHVVARVPSTILRSTIDISEICRSAVGAAPIYRMGTVGSRTGIRSVARREGRPRGQRHVRTPYERAPAVVGRWAARTAGAVHCNARAAPILCHPTEMTGVLVRWNPSPPSNWYRPRWPGDVVVVRDGVYGCEPGGAQDIARLCDHLVWIPRGPIYIGTRPHPSL